MMSKCGHHHDHDHEHHHHHEHGECDHHDHEHEHHHHHGDGECCCGHDHEHGHHHHHADDVFTSMGIESAHKYSEEELTGILKKSSAEDNGYGNILRAKPTELATEGEWFSTSDLVPW